LRTTPLSPAKTTTVARWTTNSPGCKDRETVQDPLEEVLNFVVSVHGSAPGPRIGADTDPARVRIDGLENALHVSALEPVSVNSSSPPSNGGDRRHHLPQPDNPQVAADEAVVR
jgi:hypothetical protein